MILFELETGERLVKLGVQQAGMDDLALNQTGDMLCAVSADNREVTLWDTRKSESLATFHTPQADVARVAISPDSDGIAAAASNGNLQVCNLGEVNDELQRVGLDWTGKTSLAVGLSIPMRGDAYARDRQISVLRRAVSLSRLRPVSALCVALVGFSATDQLPCSSSLRRCQFENCVKSRHGSDSRVLPRSPDYQPPELSATGSIDHGKYRSLGTSLEGNMARIGPVSVIALLRSGTAHRLTVR